MIPASLDDWFQVAHSLIEMMRIDDVWVKWITIKFNLRTKFESRFERKATRGFLLGPHKLLSYMQIGEAILTVTFSKEKIAKFTLLWPISHILFSWYKVSIQFLITRNTNVSVDTIVWEHKRLHIEMPSILISSSWGFTTIFNEKSCGVCDPYKKIWHIIFHHWQSIFATIFRNSELS